MSDFGSFLPESLDQDALASLEKEVASNLMADDSSLNLSSSPRDAPVEPETSIIDRQDSASTATSSSLAHERTSAAAAESSRMDFSPPSVTLPSLSAALGTPPNPQVTRTDMKAITSSGDRPRPYKCSTCQASFSRQHDLKRHQRLHDGTKPFQCPHCNRTFSRQDALSRHLRVDGGGAPCCGFRKPGAVHTSVGAQGNVLMEHLTPNAMKGVSAKSVLEGSPNRTPAGTPLPKMTATPTHYPVPVAAMSPKLMLPGHMTPGTPTNGDLAHYAISTPGSVPSQHVPSAATTPNPASHPHLPPLAHSPHVLYRHPSYEESFYRHGKEVPMSAGPTGSSVSDVSFLQHELVFLRKQVMELTEEKRELAQKYEELKSSSQSMEKEKKIEELEAKVNALEIEKSLLRGIVVDSTRNQSLQEIGDS